MEERPPIWRIAANILNKQSRKPTRGGPPAWGLGDVLTSHRKNVSFYEMFTRASDMD
jgi:hypothetical protein